MALNIVSIVIFVLVGVISLSMAYKNIFSKQFIPFHENAAGQRLTELNEGLQSVIIALMRISGLGFFVVGVLLILFPAANYYYQNKFIGYAVPVISFIYCFGLFIYNYQLQNKTNVKTPWQKSLGAAIAVLIGLVISII